jgi:hypothetical protein
MAKKIDYSRMKEIECSYSTHFSFNISEMEWGFDWKDVSEWWIKHATLTVVLHDGTIHNELLVNSGFIGDNIDTKWPTKILIRHNPRKEITGFLRKNVGRYIWATKEEYNREYEVEE